MAVERCNVVELTQSDKSITLILRIKRQPCHSGVMTEVHRVKTAVEVDFLIV